MKNRLDEVLCARGLAPTLARSQALILAGYVRVNGERIDKAGTLIETGAVLTTVKEERPFVSRGGGKLAAALSEFAIDVTGKTCLDVGASTGGFTDCFLQHGAAKVYAVDTGYGQMASRLREDPRVILRERTNARHLDETIIPNPVDVAAVDVSFISVRRLLAPVTSRLIPSGRLVVLVKPQFEAPRRDVPRGGVVRDAEIRAQAVRRVIEEAEKMPLVCCGEMESPIHGAKGNVEFFVVWRKR